MLPPQKANHLSHLLTKPMVKSMDHQRLVILNEVLTEVVVPLVVVAVAVVAMVKLPLVLLMSMDVPSLDMSMSTLTLSKLSFFNNCK
jgi:hypothetical protein